MSRFPRLRWTGLLLGAALLLGVSVAQAAGTLTVGMTAGDLPVTTGNPDQGFEGYRFVGYNLYDSLVLWDLSGGDKVADIKPGLATEQQALDLHAAPRREVA
jgi:ABC-type transport system substrate-binding protein